MGYIRESKNIDLVVGPSVFTEETRQTIAKAISQFKKTGQKPVSVQVVSQGSAKAITNTGGAKTPSTQSKRVYKRKAKV